MKKLTPFLIWVMLLLYACVPVVQTSEPFQTRTPFTPTPRPTETPTAVPTPTEIPDPTMPPGATGKDSKGNYIKEVTENGNTFEYTWDKEQELWTRSLGEFPLYDSTVFNYIPLKIFISNDVEGGQNLVSITHEDRTGGSSMNPLSSSFVPELEERYFQKDSSRISNDESAQLQREMMKGIKSQAFLPLITSYGESVNMRLSTETGFILTIVNAADLEPLVGNGVSKWGDGKHTYYSQVTGVNGDGNVLCKVASVDSLRDLSDLELRYVLFSCVGNVISHENQTTQNLDNITQIFTQYSAKPYGDSPADVMIERNP